MTRVLAKDLGARGINVNSIAPGPTDTDLFRAGKSEQLIQFFANLHPQKRIPQADEIAPIIAFLSRDEAGWINGQTIFVNGVSDLSLPEELSTELMSFRDTLSEQQTENALCNNEHNKFNSGPG